MPRLRPKALFLLVCLLLAPLLPPSTAQAGTTSATFSVGIRAAPRGGRLATGNKTQSNQSWRPGNVEEGRVGKEPLARPPDAARTDSSRKFDISATGLERPLLALNGHGEHADVCLLLG